MVRVYSVKKIRELLAKDELTNAIEHLQLFLIESPLLNDVLQQSGRLSNLQNQVRIGMINYSDATLTRNQIRYALFELLNEIEKVNDTISYYKEIRNFLKTRYENRLNQKLINRQPVNLKRIVSDYGTSAETSQAFIQYSDDDLRNELDKCFKDARGRLLITGSPGVGKTTLLLQLSIKLIESLYSYLPVIINLATWQPEYKDLKNWLLDMIPAELGINKRLTSKILDQNILILLFDGLDEVQDPENRTLLLSAIGRYGEVSDRTFVITSRSEEYEKTMRDAPVFLQIEVGNLTYNQVKKELEMIGNSQPEAPYLLYAALTPNFWTGKQGNLR